MQFAKPFLIQGLSEDIYQLIISLHMVDEDIAREDMVPKKMMTIWMCLVFEC